MPGHEGMNSNNFVVTKSWYDEHPEEVAFFLSVWDRGLQEWATNKDAILEAYPEDFGYKTDEELAYLKDWYDEPVRRVRRHRVPGRGRGSRERPRSRTCCADAGLVPEGQPGPMHACIDPDTGEETCLLP